MSKTQPHHRQAATLDRSRLWSRDVLWAILLTIAACAALLLALFSDGVRRDAADAPAPKAMATPPPR
jgi:ferric-dicitrate binding protein FerR (iron transport regulator)